ncbi:hypothetical protein ABTX35_38310, partial [Streptomyces sp. NPDC096080]
MSDDAQTPAAPENGAAAAPGHRSDPWAGRDVSGTAADGTTADGTAADPWAGREVSGAAPGGTG